ncbi:MAG TPA: hypothetical protein VL098_06940 [Flavipsychrobacter sp.]|nr:hypothetical protein [Flavipsychrobacter sp.]
MAGYGRIMIDEELDRLLADFYENTIGRYWDAERRYVDEHYRTIPFPFKETSAPSFVNVQHWTREHLTGYLNTWSAVKHFTRQNGYNPVVAFSEVIGRAWGEVPVREVRFPLFLRTGFIHSINDRLLPAAL